MTEEATTKRRGPKPSPITAALRKYEKARHVADKARRDYEKVQSVADALAEAEAAEQAAYDELQAVLNEKVVPPPSYTDDEGDDQE